MIRIVRTVAFASLLMIFAGANKMESKVARYEAPIRLPEKVNITFQSATNSGTLHVD